MANRTTKDAKTIHGTNPQYLIEKIIRTRIYDSRFWKEDCFALSGLKQRFQVFLLIIN
jgi:pre-mRNA-splicing factor 38A